MVDCIGRLYGIIDILLNEFVWRHWSGPGMIKVILMVVHPFTRFLREFVFYAFLRLSFYSSTFHKLHKKGTSFDINSLNFRIKASVDV